MVLSTWTLVSQFYSLCLVLGFYFGKIWSHVTIFDALPLFSFLRYVTGYEYGWTGILVIFAWLLSIFACVGMLQFVSALHQLFCGEIAFEIENRIHLKDERPVSNKIRSVFGDFWYLNFIFPISGGCFNPDDDPYHWNQLTPPKRQVHMRVL
ncbi:hypothetical protein FSP39_013079 [Pinctada imbricata]|uniref:Palmitoyltransferase n=1 Tax=Pinctada imbricata TaxID=66713 RepID=A0AA88XUJ3_PINIB|nr:hypothetical protein FSP39_013079 [Pinctada imbricata]